MDKKLELIFPKYRDEIDNLTGEWRTFRPEINYEKCTGCGICATYCPDKLIEIFTKGKKRFARIDYVYCKGCGICVESCPLGSIDFKPEKRGINKIEKYYELLQPPYKKDVIEIMWYGRGGMGVVTASELTACSALYRKKYSQSIPIFGPERAGAPVRVYTRISGKPIKIKCGVYNPDTIVFLDPSLLTRASLKGLMTYGNVIINSPEAYPLKKINVFYIDATKIALETLGRPIVSTAMAGATIRVTRIASLEDLIKAVEERFTGDIREKNIAAVKKAYESVKRIT